MSAPRMRCRDPVTFGFTTRALAGVGIILMLAGIAVGSRHICGAAVVKFALL